MAPFFAGLVMFAYSRHTVVSSFGIGNICNTSYEVPFPTISKVSIFTRSCVIASDLIVLLVILFNTHNVVTYSDVMSTATSTAALLRQDGLQYFLILLVLNVLDMSLFTTNVFDNTTSSFTIPIGAIVISRCLLNLRQLGHDEDEETQHSTVNFASEATDTSLMTPTTAYGTSNEGFGDTSVSKDVLELHPLTSSACTSPVSEGDKAMSALPSVEIVIAEGE